MVALGYTVTDFRKSMKTKYMLEGVSQTKYFFSGVIVPGESHFLSAYNKKTR